MTLSFRQEAIDDLTTIWQYTVEKWSEKQADRYYEQLKFSCYELLNNPFKGRGYPQVEKQLLGYKINKHIIFYKFLETTKEIEVIRILHEKMDLKQRLR